MLTDAARCRSTTAADPQFHRGTLWPGVREVQDRSHIWSLWSHKQSLSSLLSLAMHSEQRQGPLDHLPFFVRRSDHQAKSYKAAFSSALRLYPTYFYSSPQGINTKQGSENQSEKAMPPWSWRLRKVSGFIPLFTWRKAASSCCFLCSVFSKTFCQRWFKTSSLFWRLLASSPALDSIRSFPALFTASTVDWWANTSFWSTWKHSNNTMFASLSYTIIASNAIVLFPG